MKLDRKHLWRREAACQGRDLSDFTFRGGVSSLKFRERVKLQSACPRSCPVMAECARDAIQMEATGTVRAGCILPEKESFKHPEYRRLIEIAEPVLDETDRAFLQLNRLQRTQVRSETEGGLFL